MKPVCHFVNDHRGGLARYVERLVAAQRAEGTRELEVFGPPSLQLPDGIRRLKYSDDYRRWGSNQWRFALRSTFVRRRADHSIRHFHNLGIGPADVRTVHGIYTQNWRAKNADLRRVPAAARVQFELLSRLERSSFREARVLVYLSTSARDYVESELGIRRGAASTLILQGVDGEVYRPIPRSERPSRRKEVFPGIEAGSRWFLFVGNDFDGKGLLRLIDGLKGERQGYELLVFGSDPANHVKASEAAKSVPGRVHFFGDDARAATAFGLSDVMVLDSVSEGGSLVMIEAMSAGCVPFVTPCGAVADTIQSGLNGFVAENATSLLAAAFAATDDELTAMGAHARNTVRERTWQAVARQYEQVYRTL